MPSYLAAAVFLVWSSLVAVILLGHRWAIVPLLLFLYAMAGAGRNVLEFLIVSVLAMGLVSYLAAAAAFASELCDLQSAFIAFFTTLSLVMASIVASAPQIE